MSTIDEWSTLVSGIGTLAAANVAIFAIESMPTSFDEAQTLQANVIGGVIGFAIGSVIYVVRKYRS